MLRYAGFLQPSGKKIIKVAGIGPITATAVIARASNSIKVDILLPGLVWFPVNIQPAVNRGLAESPKKATDICELFLFMVHAL